MDYYYQTGEKIAGFTVLKLLGEGRYGIAYLAQDHHAKKYVVKQLKEKMLRSTQDKLFYEPEILKQLHSSKFPGYIGSFHNRKAQGYIMEYKAGKVFEDIVKKDRHHFSKKEIYAICHKLLAIIELLQQQGIVHRDIRLPNVIYTPQKELVLLDFGLARFIDHDRYVKQMDYWYLGDFLLHLYYTSYAVNLSFKERPWYVELDLNPYERHFLKRLMGLEREYHNIHDIKRDLYKLQQL